MKLTAEEYNVLVKIADRSKMDCWFLIDQDKDGDDYINDLENGEKLSLEDGIGDLVDGMTDYEDYCLTRNEIRTFEDLLINLGVELPSSNEKVYVTVYNDEKIQSRAQAKKEMLMCMTCSEGAEQQRYARVLLELEEGRTVVIDEE